MQGRKVAAARRPRQASNADDDAWLDAAMAEAGIAEVPKTMGFTEDGMSNVMSAG